jgi:pyruvate formate-lyase activating enzyme-like uncharacterized protein
VVFDRLYEWFCYFKKHFPHYYFWVYTNGINVTEDQLKHVAGAGMDEIRFNIAATGYVSEQVLKIISIARKMFPYVSVEIPSIKQDYLLLSLALPILNQIGVDYLNLHDYILTKPEIKPQEEKIGRFILNKVIQIEYMPSSRQNTQNIAEFCDNEMFTFKINHCSLEKKEIQMLNRRLVTGQVFSDKSYDFFSKEGLLYNFFCIPENDFNEKKIEKQVPIGSVVKFARYKMNKEMVCNEYCNNKMIVADCYLPQMEYNQDKIFLKTMLIKQGEFKNFLEQTGLAHLPDEREKISAERIE